MDLFDLMKRRAEQFHGCFRSILHPKSSFPEQSHNDNAELAKPNEPQVTENIYDDTMLENNTDKVWEWPESRNGPHVPTIKPSRGFVMDEDDDLLHSSERSIFPSRPGGALLDRLLGGLIESAVGAIENEFEAAIKDMDMAFDFDRMEGLVDEKEGDNMFARFFGQGFPLAELEDLPKDKSSETKDSVNIEANYRNLVLKPHSTDPEKSLRTPNTGSEALSEAKQTRKWDWNMESSSTIQTFNNGEGKIQTVKDTPEGREIVTKKTKGREVVEEHREFIPRKDLPPDQSIFAKLFRPKF